MVIKWSRPGHFQERLVYLCYAGAVTLWCTACSWSLKVTYIQYKYRTNYILYSFAPHSLPEEIIVRHAASTKPALPTPAPTPSAASPVIRVSVSISVTVSVTIAVPVSIAVPIAVPIPISPRHVPIDLHVAGSIVPIPVGGADASPRRPAPVARGGNVAVDGELAGRAPTGSRPPPRRTRVGSVARVPGPVPGAGTGAGAGGSPGPGPGSIARARARARARVVVAPSTAVIVFSATVTIIIPVPVPVAVTVTAAIPVTTISVSVPIPIPIVAPDGGPAPATATCPNGTVVPVIAERVSVVVTVAGPGVGGRVSRPVPGLAPTVTVVSRRASRPGAAATVVASCTGATPAVASGARAAAAVVASPRPRAVVPVVCPLASLSIAVAGWAPMVSQCVGIPRLRGALCTGWWWFAAIFDGLGLLEVEHGLLPRLGCHLLALFQKHLQSGFFQSLVVHRRWRRGSRLLRRRGTLSSRVAITR
ncbi:hypothetical protein M432DRAFT_254106 [Thermoascus aurantiacus ATCC 26904]